MLIPVILSGGAGSRLWPVSREAYPKPFIKLRDGKTLLHTTIERAAAVGADHFITVTNREYYFLTKDEYSKSSVRGSQTFLLEPCGRNTAPAVAMAALHALAVFGKDSQLLILPADHLIEDHVAFASAAHQAAKLAHGSTLVTFGIPPTHPEIGYGYIECGETLAEPQSYRVKRFVEKPSAEVAAAFVSSKQFLWNSGMFCFGAQSFIDALRECAPELHAAAKECWNATLHDTGDKIHLQADHFAKLADISIDYAVMEKYADVAVVRADFGWNDIGSWNAVGDLTSPDSNGNRIAGKAISIDSSGCFIQSNSRVVAVVGVNDLIVVDTPDALLISDKGRAQDVKRVVSQLKLSDHSTHRQHRTVHRPWGTYTDLEEGPCYRIKRIVVKPGAALSLQKHQYRSEHWVVLSGMAEVVNGERQYSVQPNESTFISAGATHRLSNPGAEDLVIIEVQTGSYVGEDDIVRLEDVYGRA